MTAELPPPVEVEDLHRRYGETRALDGVTLTVRRGEVFGLLGPNGGGKTTLFRVLTTMLAPSSGRVRVLGHTLPRDGEAVRRAIGVVFQSPSLDRHLGVRENLRHQGHLYGLTGAELAGRVAANLELFGLTAEAATRTDRLSGGQRRRAELAKGLLHDPELLLLDEPSTGLDVAGRRDLWRHLLALRDGKGVTAVVTTHLMEEAERCDRVGILDRGRLVALGTPEELRNALGGAVVRVVPRRASEVGRLKIDIENVLAVDARAIGGAVHIEVVDGTAAVVSGVLERFEADVTSVSVGRPTLEDVYLRAAGRRFR
jgi:ABC-2 type transport system ATP-binding protein